MTAIVGIRTRQISLHNNCFANNIPLSADTAVKRAKLELMQRRSPLLIQRHVGERINREGRIQKYVEIRNPNEMVFIKDYEL